MSGRKREPVNVIRMKGKSHHLTKAMIEEREKSEIKVKPKNLNIPAGLNEDQRELYIETYNDLSEYGLATHLEASVLTRFVKATYEYNNLTKMIENESDPSLYTRLLGVRLRVSDELRKCENDLGMNVFSRMKAAVPPEGDKEPSKTEQLFGEL